MMHKGVYNHELREFGQKVWMQVIKVLNNFLLILQGYDEKNLLALMLDHPFKRRLPIISFFIGQKEVSWAMHIYCEGICCKTLLSYVTSFN